VRDKKKACEMFPDGLTPLQAELLLYADLMESAKDVAKLVKVPLTENQFAALTSFHFNTGALGRSTLLKLLNAKQYAAAADQFLRWNKGTVRGKLVVLPGLVKRRAEERQLFLLGGEDGTSRSQVSTRSPRCSA
jgi:lysozyme